MAITELSARVVETARASAAKIITVESCTAGALCTLWPIRQALETSFWVALSPCKDLQDRRARHTFNLARGRFGSQRRGRRGHGGGALAKCTSATIAVAITCVGGPKPDEDGNPVGLTYIAVQRRDENALIHRLRIEEASSGRIRGEALSGALKILLSGLTEDVN